MATNSLNYLRLMAMVDGNLIQTDENREFFETHFLSITFAEQYKVMASLFAKMTNMEDQPWLLNLADKMIKEKSPSYNNSQFQSKNTMVEFFIKQFSYGELSELRSTLWALIK